MNPQNKYIGAGNLGSDPELRHTERGPRVFFNMAVDRNYPAKDPETGEDIRKSETTWIPVVVWGQQAINQYRYLKTGSLVMVEGRIENRQYVDDNGDDRTSFAVVAEDIKWMGNILTREEARDVPDEGDLVMEDTEEVVVPVA